MALEITSLTDQEDGQMHTVTDRLYKTADGKVVEDGHPDAAFLYATPGDEIPLEQARADGLIKQAPQPADKQARPARNKAKGA